MEQLVSVSHLAREQVMELIGMAMRMKRGEFSPRLQGKSLILLFFNPSLRTRTSFELAMQQLGGNVVTLNAGDDTWKLELEDHVVMNGNAAEHIRDAARVLGRYADAIGIRAFARGENWEKDRQDPVIDAFVRESGVPVINMESSLYHPNQALADIMTIMERGGTEVRKLPVTITWANHPNPLPMAVPNSILLSCALFGMDIRFLRPSGYDLDPSIMQTAEKLCGEAGGSLRVTDNIREGYAGSRVVYAKSWGSIEFYGDKELERRHRKSLSGWIVDEEKMALTDEAMFLHCLPVRRNVVVSDSVIDGKNSAVYDEAENRLHAQKAVLYSILGPADMR
jgi:N-acetylornithine carbamoyltransferase